MGGTPEAVLGASLGDLGRAPALSLLGVGADRPKWCPAESKMFRHADKALAGSFHGIRVVPACIVSPGAVQVGSSSLRSLRRISSHSMRRSLRNGSRVIRSDLFWFLPIHTLKSQRNPVPCHPSGRLADTSCTSARHPIPSRGFAGAPVLDPVDRRSPRGWAWCGWGGCDGTETAP